MIVLLHLPPPPSPPPLSPPSPACYVGFISFSIYMNTCHSSHFIHTFALSSDEVYQNESAQDYYHLSSTFYY